MFISLLRQSSAIWSSQWVHLLQSGHRWILLSLVCTSVTFAAAGGILVLGWFLIHLVSFAMIQSMCFRRCLSISDANIAERLLPGPKLVWKWTKHFLVSGLILFGVLVATFATADGMLGFSKDIAAALSLAAVFLVTPVLLRLALVLTAWSVGETFSYADAWEVSNGLGWPMVFMTSVVTFLLSAVVFAALTVLAAIGLNRSSAFGFIGLLGLETILFGLAYTTAIVLTVGYQTAKARWFADRQKLENLEAG
jgi:hypothetical protein